MAGEPAGGAQCGRHSGATDEDETILRLAFDCPAELQRAEDVLFCYAPGYGTVSILDSILASLARGAPATPPARSRTSGAGLPSEAAQGPAARAPDRTGAQTPPRLRAGAPPGAQHVVSAASTGSLLDDLESDRDSPGVVPAAPGTTAPARSVTPPRRAPELARGSAGDSEDAGKREDGFTQRRPSSGAGLPRQQPPPSGAAVARAEALCAAVENGHGKLATALEGRVRSLRALSGCWSAGDAAALVAQLTCGGDALACDVLRRLAQRLDLLPPASLARLLTLAQRLAQSDCEEHAVAAMRFVLAVLEGSWPSVSRSLRDVSTSRAELDACQGVVTQLTALFATIKNMTRSVRVSRANGPLSSVCKQLRGSLESALAAEGRVPGRAPAAAQPKARPAGGGTRLRGTRDPAVRHLAERQTAAVARERPSAEADF